MAEIGVFTPEQARLVWQDYQTRQQLAPQIKQNFPQRRAVDEPSPHRVFILNTEDEEIPAYGCVEIVATSELAGITVVEVRKPTKTDGEYLFNSQFAIAPADEDEGQSGAGWAYRFNIVRMLGSPPDEPKQYRPIVGSWEVEEGSGPFVVFGLDSVDDNVLIGRIAAAGSASSQMIEFEVVESDSSGSGSGSSSSSSSDDDACGDDSPIEGLRGKVIAVSCGASMPSDADENGVVDLVDKIGLLDGKTVSELVGRRGFATRMVDLEPEEEELPDSGSASSSGKNECYWSIVSINGFVVVSVVSDIVFGEESITVNRKNIKVWDECKLPDEVIEGTDCPLPGSSSSSGSE